MIYNLELEKQLLAALIKEPESYCEISNFISHKDFYSEDSGLHSAVFTVIKQAIDSGDQIDEVIVAQRVSSLGRADIKLDPYSKAPVRQTTATGGNALLHFANFILEFEPRYKGDLILKNASDKTIDPVTNPIIGHFAKVTVKKSPNEKTNLTISYPIKYGRTNGNSVWIEKEIVDLLLLWEFLVKGGSWYTATEEFEELLVENSVAPFGKVQGLDSVFSKIEQDQALSQFLISYFKKAICDEV